MKRATPPSKKAQALPGSGSAASRQKLASKSLPDEHSSTPDHLGLGEFVRNGKPIIKEIDVHGGTKTLGRSPSTSVLRLRPASRLPKTVAAIRKEHRMLFTHYKANERQVRTLAAMGLKVIVRSGKHAVVIDCPPDFERDLITKELRRVRSEGMRTMLDAIMPIVEMFAARAKRERKNSKAVEVKLAQKTLVDAEEDGVEDGKPYAELARAKNCLRSVMSEDLRRGIESFLDDRINSAINAELSRPTEADLDRIEVGGK